MAGQGACGACRVLKRKCAENCLFSPYFSRDQTGVDQFAAILQIFGQSHFTKMLQPLPVDRRHEAVASILYEAQARIQDPVHGCCSKILALQQDVHGFYSKNLALQQENEKLRQQLAELRSVGESSRNIQQSQISSGNGMIFPHRPQSIMSEKIAIQNYAGDASAAHEGPSSFAMYKQREYMRSDMSSLSKLPQMDLEMGAWQFDQDTWK